MDFAMWDLPSIITTMWKFEWNCKDNDEIAMRMINVDLLGWFWVRKSHLYMLKLFWKSLVSFRHFLDTFLLLLKFKRTLRHSWWVEFRLVHLDTWSHYVFDEYSCRWTNKTFKCNFFINQHVTKFYLTLFRNLRYFEFRLFWELISFLDTFYALLSCFEGQSDTYTLFRWVLSFKVILRHFDIV